jgi:FAD/FMN-containing dehydrogenase
MIGNNSAGSQSVRYGMTIDHVLALDVVLSDASTAAFGPLTAAELAARAARPTLEGAICRGLPALAARNAEAIATGYPRFWRQSGGYRLDRLAGRGGPGGLDLARFVVGSEGTLVTVVAAEVALVPVPRHRVIAVGHFTSAEAAIEPRGRARLPAAAVSLIDAPSWNWPAPSWVPALSSILTGDPRRCCSSRSSATPRRKPRPPWTGWTRCGAGTPAATTRCGRGPLGIRRRC